MSAKKSLPRKIDFVYFDENDNEVLHEVRKLPLGRSAELVTAFNELPKVFQGLMGDEETRALFEDGVEDMGLVDIADLIGNNLGSIMAVALDAVINILHVGSGLEKKVVESLGLDEASELFLAIVTVNNLGAMQANLKNGMTLLFPSWGTREQRAQKAMEMVVPKKSGSKT
mgnify:CR=1 FL=1